MITTTPPPTRRGLVQPRIPRDVAMRLAATEYDRSHSTLAALDDADWSRPTPCTAWDVRDIRDPVRINAPDSSSHSTRCG